MAELAKLKKVEKVEKVEVEKPKRHRKPDFSVTEIIPEPLWSFLRGIYRIFLIPASLIIGLFDGICFGFVKGLETALGMYKRELEK